MREDSRIETFQDWVNHQPQIILFLKSTVYASNNAIIIHPYEQSSTSAIQEGTGISAKVQLEHLKQVIA